MLAAVVVAPNYMKHNKKQTNQKKIHVHQKITAGKQKKDTTITNNTITTTTAFNH